jgi:Lon protease-like protein
MLRVERFLSRHFARFRACETKKVPYRDLLVPWAYDETIRRMRHERSLEERALQAAQRAREETRSLPVGKEGELLLRKARYSEVAANISKSSPGPQRPL